MKLTGRSRPERRRRAFVPAGRSQNSTQNSAAQNSAAQGSGMPRRFTCTCCIPSGDGYRNGGLRGCHAIFQSYAMAQNASRTTNHTCFRCGTCPEVTEKPVITQQFVKAEAGTTLVFHGWKKEHVENRMWLKADDPTHRACTERYVSISARLDLVLSHDHLLFFTRNEVHVSGIPFGHPTGRISWLRRCPSLPRQSQLRRPSRAWRRSKSWKASRRSSETSRRSGVYPRRHKQRGK